MHKWPSTETRPRIIRLHLNHNSIRLDKKEKRKTIYAI